MYDLEKGAYNKLNSASSVTLGQADFGLSLSATVVRSIKESAASRVRAKTVTIEQSRKKKKKLCSVGVTQ